MLTALSRGLDGAGTLPPADPHSMIVSVLASSR